MKKLLEHIAGWTALIPLKIAAALTGLRLCRVYTDRLGHMCVSELFIRKQKAGLIKTNPGRVFWHYDDFSKEPANKQLFAMIDRELHLRRSRFLYKLTALPPVAESSIIEAMPKRTSEYPPFSHLSPGLTFTPEEEAEGAAGLQKMGIGPKDWFVCFHNRDSSYLKKRYPKRDWAHHGFRDHSVENMIDAMRFVAEEGGFALRMGAEISEKLPVRHPRIIDYAAEHRSDFMDIFLPSRCRYMISGTAGMHAVSLIFNVPIGLVNFVPLTIAHNYKYSAFIPKTLRWKKNGAELSAVDIFSRTETVCLEDAAGCAAAGIEIIENTPEEILGLTREVHEAAAGKRSYSEQDEQRHRRYVEIALRGRPAEHDAPRIARDFLDRHPSYLT